MYTAKGKWDQTKITNLFGIRYPILQGPMGGGFSTIDLLAAVSEAGGHRPSFLRPASESLTGTFALVQQVAAKVRVPIIAAGGIGDSKSAAAAMLLGADAVQLGTAFLACEESNATPTHRDRLFSDNARYTVLTKSLTGRLGRMQRNRISTEIGEEREVLPFPLQAQFIAPLRAAALAQGKTDLINFWSGQAAPLLKHHTAKAVMQELIDEVFG
jgi:nitronate monooxygenase